MKFWSIRRSTMAVALTLSWALAALSSSTPVEHISIVTESWESYTNKDGSGLYLDITRAIYEPLGIRVDVDFMPFTRAMFTIENQSADAMYGTYSEEIERKPFLLTPENPIDVEQTIAIFKRDRIGQWQGETSLKEKELAWVRGYDYDDYLSFSLEQYTEVVDTRQGLDMLAAGRFDVLLDHGGELAYVLRNTGFDTTEYETRIVFEKDLFMAFANNERGRELARIFDDGVTRLKESGQLSATFEKYESTGRITRYKKSTDSDTQ